MAWALVNICCYPRHGATAWQQCFVWALGTTGVVDGARTRSESGSDGGCDLSAGVVRDFSFDFLRGRLFDAGIASDSGVLDRLLDVDLLNRVVAAVIADIPGVVENELWVA